MDMSIGSRWSDGSKSVASKSIATSSCANAGALCSAGTDGAASAGAELASGSISMFTSAGSSAGSSGPNDGEYGASSTSPCGGATNCCSKALNSACFLRQSAE